MAQGGRVFDMVLEHEYMHQETLLYMMQELPLEKKHRPSPSPRYSFHAAPTSRRFIFPPEKPGSARDSTKSTFGWDNEFSAKIVDVPAFDIDSPR